MHSNFGHFAVIAGCDGLNPIFKSFPNAIKHQLRITVSFWTSLLYHQPLAMQKFLLTDSLPALWALEKGRSSTCLYSSTICLAIATILQSLQCYYFLKHVKRKTTYAATVSDALTRDDKAGDIYSNIFIYGIKTMETIAFLFKAVTSCFL